MTLPPLIVAALIAQAGTPETWVGHQVTFGQRSVPILGDLATRTDTYVVATVRRLGEWLEIEQTACAVEFAPVLGVEVSMPDESLRALPRPRTLWRLTGTTLAGAEGFSGWGNEDLDGDGHPGLTILVDAPMCDGALYVASGTTTHIEGTATPELMRGRVDVRVQQEILAASSRCLTWGQRDTDERQTGVFAFVRQPGASCASLRGRRWPVRADAQAPSPGGSMAEASR